jgi:hypothetical protein
MNEKQKSLVIELTKAFREMSLDNEEAEHDAHSFVSAVIASVSTLEPCCGSITLGATQGCVVLEGERFVGASFPTYVEGASDMVPDEAGPTLMLAHALKNHPTELWGFIRGLPGVGGLGDLFENCDPNQDPPN